MPKIQPEFFAFILAMGCLIIAGILLVQGKDVPTALWTTITGAFTYFIGVKTPNQP